MTDLIPISELNTDSDEPRVLDLHLADWLGLSQARNLRSVIADNREELELYGSLHVARANPSALGGRPGKAYLLNEGQALVLCALSRTEKAAHVRRALIEVFQAYRQGKVVHVKEHRRLPPSSVPKSRDWQRQYARLLEFVPEGGTVIELLTSAFLQLERVESRLADLEQTA